MDTTRRMAFEMNCLLTINAYHGLYDPPIDSSPGPNSPLPFPSPSFVSLALVHLVCVIFFGRVGTKG
ncbi:hypothetical protein J3E72DRAFT_333746, partial [Bipolaris maydis]|uniref:uncharacterized protein n=1 Tax=Cochliobolus heterostrophus TaxID=5016 RepID=UPI0024CEFF55